MEGWREKERKLSCVRLKANLDIDISFLVFKKKSNLVNIIINYFLFLKLFFI